MWKGGLPVHLNIQNKEDQHQSHQYSLFKNKFVSPYQIILYNDEKEPPSRRMMDDGDDDDDDDDDDSDDGGREDYGDNDDINDDDDDVHREKATFVEQGEGVNLSQSHLEKNWRKQNSENE